MNQPLPERAVPARGVMQRVHEGLHRHRFLLAPLSFGLGVASFMLIQRSEGLARWLAVLLLATWLFSVVEVLVPRRLKLAPSVLRFITQQTHQEAFFFTLPFLLQTTSWQSGQAVFTTLVIVAAACSMWDPLYFGQIVRRRWLYLGFHALASYVVMLVALPLLLQLTTAQTLALSAGAIVLFAAPSLGEPPDRDGRPIGWYLFGGALALAALAWVGRSLVPPATLWLGDATITTVIDTKHRVPGMDTRRIDPALAVERGVYAYTAIVAPRGLHERVFHEWYQGRRLVASVPLEIIGGREEGYRAWTHKTGFNGAKGRWNVRVVTESGQLIGKLRFVIAEDPSKPAAGPLPVPKPLEQAPDAPVFTDLPPPPAQSAPRLQEWSYPEPMDDEPGNGDVERAEPPEYRYQEYPEYRESPVVPDVPDSARDFESRREAPRDEGSYVSPYESPMSEEEDEDASPPRDFNPDRDFSPVP